MKSKETKLENYVILNIACKPGFAILHRYCVYYTMVEASNILTQKCLLSITLAVCSSCLKILSISTHGFLSLLP